MDTARPVNRESPRLLRSARRRDHRHHHGVAMTSSSFCPQPQGALVKTASTSTRRQFVKIGGAAMVAIPILAATGSASAATNAQMRAALKYQDKPNGDKDCAGCMQFIPGKKPTDLGGCKIMAGDTEISPKGYCTAWTAKAK
jgi:hypothetical protein